MTRVLLLLTLAALAATIAACTGVERVATVVTEPPPPDDPAALATSTLDEDTVHLTVYLRSGSGADALLVPTSRRVEVTEDLPRRALELLLAGPIDEEAGSLAAVLPRTTRVLAFSQEGGTALVDLSGDVIEDAATVGGTPRDEALGLAALANTLTEFPTIDNVVVTIEGRRPDAAGTPDIGAFWGGWGLPGVLVRDETVVAPAKTGDELPDLAAFSTDTKVVGGPDAAPVRVSGVRAHDRITYLRVVVELTSPADPATAAPAVPSARARASSDRILLDIDGVAEVGTDPVSGQLTELDEQGFHSLGISSVGDDTVRITLLTAQASLRLFHLYTETSPTRIVLDVKK